jgi:hypothetical protein
VTTTTSNVGPLLVHAARQIDSKLLPYAIFVLVIVGLAAFIWSKRPKWMP